MGTRMVWNRFCFASFPSWQVRCAIIGSLLFGVACPLRGGEFLFTAGSRTIARTAALEPIPDQPQSSEVIEPPELFAQEFFQDGGFAESCQTDYWMSGEYLMWWRKGRGLPALATSSTAGTALTDAGVLGLATTSVLYGQEDVGTGGRPGGRFSTGAWCDPCRVWGIGSQVTFLAESNTRFELSNADRAIIARPFLNVTDAQPVQQDSLVIAFPGLRTGSLVVQTSSDLLGGDVYLRRLISDNGRSRLDFQVGYQFSRIDESLSVRSVTDAQDLAAILTVTDNFWTRNEFHGASLGLAYAMDDVRWSCRALAKVGLGNMHQTARLSGEQIIDDGVAPVVANTGLLVQSTNRGTFNRDTFAAIPELNLTAIFHLNTSVDLSLGYTYILWSDVLQPGGVIDPSLAVNLANAPILQRPSRVLNDDNYWAHGLNLGLVWRY